MYKREEAVSPVIGVILMVAITVILAAVIAAFVFGMAGNVQKTKNVAFTVERSATSQTDGLVTFQGGKDAKDVSVADILVGTSTTAQTGPTIIGSSQTITGLSAGQKTKVVIRVTFRDGSQQVVVDTQV